jgi:hypothetical protein
MLMFNFDLQQEALEFKEQSRSRPASNLLSAAGSTCAITLHHHSAEQRAQASAAGTVDICFMQVMCSALGAVGVGEQPSLRASDFSAPLESTVSRALAHITPCSSERSNNIPPPVK